MKKLGLDLQVAKYLFDNLNNEMVYFSNKQNSSNGYLAFVLTLDDTTAPFIDPKKGYISQAYQGVSFNLANAYLMSVDLNEKFHRPQPSHEGNVIRIEKEDLGIKVNEFLKTGSLMHSLENDFSGAADKKRELWESYVIELFTKYGSKDF